MWRNRIICAAPRSHPARATAAASPCAPRAAQRLGEMAQLVVDEDAQRLERARGRMDVARTRAHDARDERGERAGGADRLALPCGDDRPRHRARAPFLAKEGKDRAELPLGSE